MTPAPLVALVGNPNAGKSALFNALTGARQKVGNYPGVTVERYAGRLTLPDGRPVELVDLPGAYSLDPASPDEVVTRDVVTGTQQGERLPDLLVIVVDATNLDNHLRFALQLVGLGIPSVVALNMVDLAERDGLTLDADILSRELGVPVVPTVAVRRRGLDALVEAMGEAVGTSGVVRLRARAEAAGGEDIVGLQRRARVLSARATVDETPARRLGQTVDSVALNPVAGPLLLLAVLFLMFQAVFAWSDAPIGWIESAQEWVAGVVAAAVSEGLLRSFLVDGVINGVGSVVVFLPQILILFAFILVLEASGYMARAAFLMDRMMGRVGLNGRAFIPLLSSFACAVPGIMATRTIAEPKERLTTILVAPLMTCSARLPVYAVVIAAFIPARDVGGVLAGWGVGLQGVVLLALYLAGIVGALAVALALRSTRLRGSTAGMMMELPRWQWPQARDLTLGLWQRAYVFLRRAGTVIFTATIALWLLLSFPRAPEGQQLERSIAGRLATAIQPVFAPIGFNRDIVLALVPAMAAREVAVSALATAYSVDGSVSGDPAVDATDQLSPEDTDQALGARLATDWSLPTALAFLAWFVFAPQCLSTIAVARRETNSLGWTTFMVTYLFALAYVGAGVTYRLATAAGL